MTHRAVSLPRTAHHPSRLPALIFFGLAAAAILAVILFATPSHGAVGAGENTKVEDVLQAVVQVSASIPADARTAGRLGTEREGSGVVIDSEGLVLTIGYLMLEAQSAEIVLGNNRHVAARLIAYDHETGFGLIRAAAPLGVTPLELGTSAEVAERDPVMVASFGGPKAAMAAYVVSRRPFAGWWEYLLEKAIFTSPPHPAFGGAALINSAGKLIGIGSLIVGDAAGPRREVPGNMFVPVDLLKPILGDLLASGRRSGSGWPWLGVTSQEVHGRLFVTRVRPNGPAYSAGIRRGDLILGVAGKPVTGLADFYRKVWSVGKAGVTVPIKLLHGAEMKPVQVKSISRYDWLKLRRERSY